MVQFVVFGQPVSFQARWRDRVRGWISTVRTAAEAAVGPDHVPLSKPTRVEITYYFGKIDIDVDNLAKPILDAMKGNVILDDRLVVDLTIRKRERTVAARRKDHPLLVANALIKGGDFVHVVVDEALVEGEQE